ncbi:MAG TPA: SAM-dependent chlorinase/fluorinase [Terriglobales bacterium]|nr:SAM-dependent chlorinase/fluorinase [Terriglobales bacterium]
MLIRTDRWQRQLMSLLVFVAIAGASDQLSTVAEQTSSTPATHTVVFMTDFGLQDDSVAICKAVMFRVDPSLRIMDITHQVTPYSVMDGARFLAGTTSYYGPGTVFVVVIDPGVGSSRKAIVAKSILGQYFVLPDNGLLTMIEDRDGIVEAREITNTAWMIGSKLSSTFHGRDIFSPVGARIARGEDWTDVGPVVPKLVRLGLTPAKMQPNGLSGQIIAIDGPYGNLITNIDSDVFAQLGYKLGELVHFTLASKPVAIRFVRTFSDVRQGEPLLYIDSRGRLAIAINQGNAQAKLHVILPSPLIIRKR